MPNLQIGSLVLNTELLLYLLAGAIGVLLVRIGSRRLEAASSLVSSAWNAVFIWLMIWKFSYIAFEFAAFRHNWKSILFFDGGIKGFVLASAASAVFAFLSFKKVSDWKSAWRMVGALGFGFIVVFELAQIIFAQDPRFIHYLLLFWSVLIIFITIKPLQTTVQQALPKWLGALLITCLLSYFSYDLIEKNFRAVSSSTVAAEQNVGIKVGQFAPDFTTTNLQGEEVSLSNLKGKTVLLNFWTTWCTVCKAEMPHVQKLYEELDSQDVVILSVNATSQDSGVKEAQHYIEKNGLTFPIALDPSGDISKAYKVRAFPVTLVIDPEGKVTKHHIGAISYEQMKKAVQAR